jgi:hypothetical protein
MKSFFWLLLLSFNLYSISSFGQFSGEITYKFEYKNPTSQSLTSQLNDVIIDSVAYWINGSGYHSISYAKGKIYEEYIYDAASKRMLFSMDARPYYLYLQTDLEKFKVDKALDIQKKPQENIIGFTTYRAKNLHTGEINFFSDQLQVETEEYQTHYFSQWNKIMEETNGSIPLKSISKQNGVSIIKTAIKVVEIPADELIFKIDHQRKQVAAYNNLDEVIPFPELNGNKMWCYQSIVERQSNKLIDGKDYQITLRFVIHEDEHISHIEVVESKYPYLNEAAKKIIAICDLGFEAGKINGKPVSSEIYYPVNF